MATLFILYSVKADDPDCIDVHLASSDKQLIDDTRNKLIEKSAENAKRRLFNIPNGAPGLSVKYKTALSQKFKISKVLLDKVNM